MYVWELFFEGAEFSINMGPELVSTCAVILYRVNCK